MGELSTGFFDRLGDSAPKKRGRVVTEDLVDQTASSIRRQMQLLLNARKGASLSAPDFGLGDFNDFTFGATDMISLIRQDIRDTIERYEPRIKIRSILHDAGAKNPLELSFVVDGAVQVGERSHDVAFTLSMDRSSRHFTI